MTDAVYLKLHFREDQTIAIYFSLLFTLAGEVQSTMSQETPAGESDTHPEPMRYSMCKSANRVRESVWSGFIIGDNVEY